jgi:hypothetical protein
MQMNNIFIKYKSHVIATLVSLLVNGLLILILFIKSGDNLIPFDSKTESDQELAIQFKILDEIPSTAIETKNKINEEVKSVRAITNSETSNNLQNNEDTSLMANNDSIILTEMKKTLQDIKIEMPKDSLPDEQVLQQEVKKMQQGIVNNVNQYYEDKKFNYDNYRMIYNLKIIYPYVMKVREVVDNLNANLATMTNKQEKRKLIKKTESELFAQFEKDVRKMSYSQGKLLLKLIARETNESAYGLIKTYKGGIPASFWYTVGMIFQEDLKVKYDSVGSDAILEKVVKKYKQGSL